MTHVTIEIPIERPAEEVFAYLSNPENNPKWQGGMQVCTITSEGLLGVGSTYKQEAAFLGRKIESDFEIVAYEPGRMIKGKSVASTFPITFERRVEPDGSDKSIVRAVITGDASGVFRLFSPILDRMVRRSIEKDYANLKRVMEGKMAAS